MTLTLTLPSREPAPRPREPRRKVSRHRVREAIEQMIFSGRCRGGSKLVQEDLARRLGVARGVVREAILELRGSGLVETVDNRGMYVAPLSVKKLLESYELREVNEGLAARLCCRRITRAQVEELREQARQIHRLAKSGRGREGGQLDRALHQRVMEIAGNEELVRMSRQFVALGKLVQVRSDPETTLAHHMTVLDAIESNDPDAAERAMRQHVRMGRAIVERAIAGGKFKPRWLV